MSFYREQGSMHSPPPPPLGGPQLYSIRKLRHHVNCFVEAPERYQRSHTNLTACILILKYFSSADLLHGTS